MADKSEMGETRVAEAERDKSIQVANAHKLREIGTREAEREQAVRVATLEREQKVAEQQAVFEREAQVKHAEQAMRVSVAEANAKAIEGENQSQAMIAASQAELDGQEGRGLPDRRNRGNARRKRRCWKPRTAPWPRRRWPKPNASRPNAAPRSKPRPRPKRPRIIVEAEAEAEKRRIEAKGEADAIFAKLEAEARGQYEILAKKGEGLQRIIDACGGAKEAFQMLMLEHFDNLAEASAKAISNIKFDKVVVWENGSQNGHGNTANFLQSMARTLPPMMQVMKDIGGVELPESLVKFASDGDPVVAKTDGESPSDVTARNGAKSAANN